MDALITLPIIIPLFIGSVGILFRKDIKVQRYCSLAGSALHLAVGTTLLAEVHDDPLLARVQRLLQVFVEIEKALFEPFGVGEQVICCV